VSFRKKYIFSKLAYFDEILKSSIDSKTINRTTQGDQKFKIKGFLKQWFENSPISRCMRMNSFPFERIMYNKNKYMGSAHLLSYKIHVFDLLDYLLLHSRKLIAVLLIKSKLVWKFAWVHKVGRMYFFEVCYKHKLLIVFCKYIF
jgi:hypothetical protein